MNISQFDNKKIRLFLRDGSSFEGFAVHHSFEYCSAEFGIDAECLQLCDYLIQDIEIERAEPIEEQPTIQNTEEDLAMLFSVKRSFSEHLMRWEDNELPDKYDHNFFEYTSQPSREKFELALDYQRERGDAFIKLSGKVRLQDDFGLASQVTLTMQLMGGTENWAMNDEIEIKDPLYKDLKEIELKHFGSVYGDDFTVRNMDRLLEYLDFRGAYLGNKLLGAYHSFSSNGFTCVDGLIVDKEFRNRHIATTLLKHAVSEASGTIVFLHADRDGCPRKLYEKLGFREVDRIYEYLSTDRDLLNFSGRDA